MLKSMTAYGRASTHGVTGHLAIEIQSVNRKFLDVNIFLPKELRHFDCELRQWLHPHLSRGQITMKISAVFEGMTPFVIRPNLSLARQLKEAWLEIAKSLGLKEEEFKLSFLTQADGLICSEENLEVEETYRQILKQLFEQALTPFLQMKSKEGAVLEADIIMRLGKIREIFSTIEQKAPDAPKKYREKLLIRLEELLPGHVENEERILREIALFAEKIDIVEEITRFYCHLDHFQELMQATSPCVGETLEFVLQELNREINTVGSKSNDKEIGRAVIDIKSELKRIREQIQNIE